MNYKEQINEIFKGVNTIFDTKKIVGDKICIGDTTIIPLIEVSCGMGIGEFKNKNSGGMATKVSPVACIIYNKGMTKIVNVRDKDPINKLIEILPDIINKMTNRSDMTPDVEEVIDNINNIETRYSEDD